MPFFCTENVKKRGLYPSALLGYTSHFGKIIRLSDHRDIKESDERATVSDFGKSQKFRESLGARGCFSCFDGSLPFCEGS